MSVLSAYGQMLIALICLLLAPLGLLIQLGKDWETWAARFGWVAFFFGAGVGSLYCVYLFFATDLESDLPLYYELALLAQALGVAALGASIAPYLHELAGIFRRGPEAQYGREKDRDA